jgi:hypothetical protein
MDLYACYTLIIFLWKTPRPVAWTLPDGAQTTGGIPMASSIVTADSARAAAEYRDIHLAACRYRAQGLVCSACSDVVERAERLARRAGIGVAEAA